MFENKCILDWHGGLESVVGPNDLGIASIYDLALTNAKKTEGRDLGCLCCGHRVSCLVLPKGTPKSGDPLVQNADTECSGCAASVARFIYGARLLDSKDISYTVAKVFF